MSARKTDMRGTDVGHIQNGWNAYDANGERIGDVVEVDSTYVLVRKGMFFPKDLYIPLAAVTSVDEAGATFFVNVTKDNVEAQAWDNPPTVAGWDTTNTSRDSFTVPVREERVEAEKHERAAGEVTVDKRVVEQQQEFDVPVSTRRSMSLAGASTDRRMPATRSWTTKRRSASHCGPRRSRSTRTRESSRRSRSPSARSPRRGASRRRCAARRSTSTRRMARPHPDRREPRIERMAMGGNGRIGPTAGDSVPGGRGPANREATDSAASRVAYVIADAHGSCLDATDAALVLLGVGVDSLRMLRVGDLSDSDGPDPLTEQLIASCDKVGQWLDGTCQLVRANGAPVRVRFAALRMKSGGLAVRFAPIDEIAVPREPRDVLQVWREQERELAVTDAGSTQRRIAELEASWLAAEYQRLAIARAESLDGAP